MTDGTQTLFDDVREIVLDAFGNQSGMATVDLPDGGIGVICFDQSEVFLVTVRPGKFVLAEETDHA